MLRITKDTKFPDIQDSIDIINGFQKNDTSVDNSWALSLNNIPEKICEEFVGETLLFCESLPNSIVGDLAYMNNGRIVVKMDEWHTDIGEDITNLYVSKRLDINNFLIIHIKIYGGSDFCGGNKKSIILTAHEGDYMNWNARFNLVNTGNKRYTMSNNNLKILFNYIYQNSTNSDHLTPNFNEYYEIISNF